MNKLGKEGMSTCIHYITSEAGHLCVLTKGTCIKGLWVKKEIVMIEMLFTYPRLLVHDGS